MQNWIRKNSAVHLKEVECANGIVYLEFPILNDTKIVKHAFSTRLGGVSKEEFSSLNFSLSKNDKKENVIENYNKMAEALGVEKDSFILTYQTHTTNVLKVGLKDKGTGLIKERPYKDVDGLITSERGVTLVSFFADCIPLYFLDTKNKAIGLAHSGWRGSLNNMAESMIKELESNYKSKAEDIIACIGPGICASCYEISKDVAELFEEKYKEKSDEILLYLGKGKYKLDLWKVNEINLLKAGVSKENIYTSDICTACNPELLFSHRKMGEKRGNLAAFLALS